MKSVGEALQGVRQKQGLDLATIAAQTKISTTYLKAIEADDRKSLPSGFFYKSFVHQYAEALGLDAHEIDTEVEHLLSADAPLPLPGQESVISKNLPRVTIPKRFSAHNFSQPGAYASGAVLLAVMLGCSAIYAWWGRTRTEAAAPDKSQAVQQSSIPTTLASSRQTAPVVQSPPAEQQALADTKVMVDLVARELTWLSATSDGKRVFTGTLAPNETKSVAGKEFTKLTIGNAAGLEVRLNGRLLAPLGTHGQVLTVLFTPEDFRIVPQQPAQPQPPKESD